MMNLGDKNNWLIGVIVIIAIIVIIYFLYPDVFSKNGNGKSKGKGESYYNPSTFSALPPAYAGSLRGTM